MGGRRESRLTRNAASDLRFPGVSPCQIRRPPPSTRTPLSCRRHRFVAAAHPTLLFTPARACRSTMRRAARSGTRVVRARRLTAPAAMSAAVVSQTGAGGRCVALIVAYSSRDRLRRPAVKPSASTVLWRGRWDLRRHPADSARWRLYGAVRALASVWRDSVRCGLRVAAVRAGLAGSARRRAGRRGAEGAQIGRSAPSGDMDPSRRSRATSTSSRHDMAVFSSRRKRGYRWCGRTVLKPTASM